MKVLQVGKFYYPYRGGMETYLLDLCQGLKDKVNLRVLVSNTSRHTVRERVRGVEVTRAGNWGRLFSTSLSPSFPSWFRKLPAEIISIQHPDPLAALSYLLSRPPGRLVVVYQSDIIRQKFARLVYRPILLKFLRRADAIIVSSPCYLDSSSILRNFKEKCVIVPIGIDSSAYEPSPEQAAKAAEIRRKYGTGSSSSSGDWSSTRGSSTSSKRWGG
jgi:rhamnosyl/mannosyltransferase